MKATNEQLKTALKKILNAYEALQASDGAQKVIGQNCWETAGSWVGRRMETPITVAKYLVE